VSLVCLQIDMNNENTSVLGCIMIGTGCGINLTKSGAWIGPQGVRIQDSMLANSGAAYNIHIGGNSANTYVTDTVCDQAGTNAILIDGSSGAVTITGGWMGLQSVSTGVSLSIDPTVLEVLVEGVQIYGGNYNIVVGANSGHRMGGLQILDNQFSGATNGTMQLDSVNGCTITGNRDYNVATVPSLITLHTNASGGQYIIGANAFTTTTPTLHSGSSYKSAGASTGWSLEAAGQSSSASGTTLVVTHGMNNGLTPDMVLISQLGGAAMTSEVAANSATTFTIAYGTSGSAAFCWMAKISR
jgi:hypothetical protein